MSTGVADAISRSVPALDNPAARSGLTDALQGLEAALEGNVTASRTALGRARAELEEARAALAQFPGDAADLTAVQLILDQAALAVAGE